jgi:hypothetical protein
MANAAPSALVVGHAYSQHRCFLSHHTTSSGSREFREFGLLRHIEHRHVSQLPGANAGHNFSLWVVMLRDSIGLLRALSYADDTVLVGDPFIWNGRR